MNREILLMMSGFCSNLLESLIGNGRSSIPLGICLLQEVDMQQHLVGVGVGVGVGMGGKKKCSFSVVLMEMKILMIFMRLPEQKRSKRLYKKNHLMLPIHSILIQRRQRFATILIRTIIM